MPSRGDIQPQPLPFASPQPEGRQVGDHAALGREDRAVDRLARQRPGLAPIPHLTRRLRDPVRQIPCSICLGARP